jgi:hypothetical protein
MPAITDQVLSSSCGLGELRGEALDPAVDRDVVDLDPALGLYVIRSDGRHLTKVLGGNNFKREPFWALG